MLSSIPERQPQNAQTFTDVTSELLSGQFMTSRYKLSIEKSAYPPGFSISSSFCNSISPAAKPQISVLQAVIPQNKAGFKPPVSNNVSPIRTIYTKIRSVKAGFCSDSLSPLLSTRHFKSRPALKTPLLLIFIQLSDGSPR